MKELFTMPLNKSNVIKCEKCNKKAIAWIGAKNVCNKCYQELKSKTKIGKLAMQRLNVKMLHESRNTAPL